MKNPTARLTPNETDILDRLARGDKVAAIADDWGTSRTAVYRHLERARKVLGAKTVPHAVALWLGASRNGAADVTQGDSLDVPEGRGDA